MSKKVAVCMTTYNRNGIYQNSLNVLFQQQYRDLKFYVVDDCSTDNTVDKLVSLTTDFGEIFKAYRTQQHNYIDALNLALRKVEDDIDYICWCDDDDYYIQDKIKKQFDYMEEHPEVDVLGCLTMFGKQNVLAATVNNMTHEDIKAKLEEGNGMNEICHFQSCMFRRSVLKLFKDQKYFLPEYIGGRAGEAFLYELYAKGCVFASINTTAYIYNVDLTGERQSMSTTMIPVFANEINKLPIKERLEKILKLYAKYNNEEIIEEVKEEVKEETPKKKPGRPKKVKTEEVKEEIPKKKPGRPKKVKE